MKYKLFALFFLLGCFMTIVAQQIKTNIPWLDLSNDENRQFIIA